MTRLPLALAPLEDETWPSYLTRRAAQHGTTLAGLGTHLGLRDHRGRWPGRFGVNLGPVDLMRVAPLLGLAPQQVERMHLSSYDQAALDLGGLKEHRGIAATRASAHAGWVWLSGTTYCPVCLDEDAGAWRLSWRIPWNTTCLRHEVHLVGACPTCGGIPGLGNRFHGSAPARVAAAPDGRRCHHPVPGGLVCGQDLTEQTATAANPERLRRARVMAGLTAGGRGHVAGIARTSLHTLRAWQSAIGIAVRLGRVDADGWGRTHRWGNPPRDPDVIDRLLAAVEPLVAAASVPAATEVLEGWLRDAGVTTPHADTFQRITQPSAALQPVIDELLKAHGRAHTQIRRQLTGADGTAAAALAWNLEDVPQLVWPCALPDHLRHHTRPDHRILRAVVSLTLVRWLGDASDWASAGAALGMPGARARGWARYAFGDRWGLKPVLLDAAQRLLPLLALQPDQRAWHQRPALRGNGLVAFRHAQQPRCRRDLSDSPWCPCTPGSTRRSPR